MKARDFLSHLQHDAIVKAIADAESHIHGEIRVFISRKQPADPVEAAQKIFHHLGLEKKPDSRAILIFVAPGVKKFAVFGSKEIHDRCGDSFWTETTHEMSGYFKKGEFSEGLLHGINRAAKLMAEHFPRLPGQHNHPGHLSHD